MNDIMMPSIMASLVDNPDSSGPTVNGEYRPDIDGLRAVALLYPPGLVRVGSGMAQVGESTLATTRPRDFP